MNRTVEKRMRTRRAVLPVLIAGVVIMMVLGSCYSPVSQSEQGFSMDVTMESRGLPEGDTVVLAGLLINSGFEDPEGCHPADGGPRQRSGPCDQKGDRRQARGDPSRCRPGGYHEVQRQPLLRHRGRL
ncbi:MAG: hypothetical protein U5P10_05145 [Spirochaetia bacterium]|nr:hypothetical protein [Spirochaetia bacterium]